MIIYALVARGTLVLAEFTSFDGDFPQMARKVLAKSPRSKLKKTYVKEGYAFTFFSEDEFTFFCMNPTDVGRDITYKFLDKLANMFYSDYDKTDEKNQKSDGASWSAKFSNLIKNLMDEFQKAGENDKLKRIESDLKIATDVAKDNIDRIFERGMRLDDLQAKTANLKSRTETFRLHAKKLRQDQSFVQKYKVCMISGFALTGLGLATYFFM